MQSLRLSFSGALALAALAIFSFSCSSDSTAEKSAAPTPASAPTTANSTQSDSMAATAAQEAPKDTAAAAAAQPVAPTADDTPTRTLSENKIGTQLIYITESMKAENLEYRSDLGQDCSGIYHRIKDSIQVRIPALGNKSKYIYPSFSTDRTSRGVARWYHEHNNLHMVEDGKADANRIRPGSVLFFANTDKKYSNMNIDLLAGPKDGSVKGVIMHIATVVSVEKDEAGNVTKYTMMHGRNKKYTASPTGGNCDCGFSTGKQHEKFPFGNYNQQWVAVANIETPVL